jgi:hypothetical protein
MKSAGIFSWIRLPKWVVLSFSFIFTILFPALFFPELSGFCLAYQPNCIAPYSALSWAVVWAPILLLLSIITYPLEKKIFDSWIRFALPWIFFSILVTLFVPDKNTFGEPDWKGLVALLLTGIFTLISLVIILTKSIKFYRRT